MVHAGCWQLAGRIDGLSAHRSWLYDRKHGRVMGSQGFQPAAKPWTLREPMTTEEQTRQQTPATRHKGSSTDTGDTLRLHRKLEALQLKSCGICPCR